MSRIVFMSRKMWGILFLLLIMMLYGRFLWQKGSQNLILLSLSQTLQAQDVSQYPQLESRLRKVNDGSDSITLSRGLGLLLAAAGDEDEFDNVWHEAEIPVTEMFHWGEIARQNQQFDVALAWYARSIHANYAWAEPWYFTGIILEERQQTQEALTVFEQAAQANKFTQVGISDVYARIGRLYESSGKNQLAALNYEKALEKNDFRQPFSKVLSLNGAAAGLIRAGKYESAIKLLVDAIEIDSNYGWSYIRLGRAYEACCQDQVLALQYLEEAMRLSSDNKWVYLTAGDVYAAHGQLAEARQMYEQALVIDPDWEKVQALLTQLDN